MDRVNASLFRPLLALSHGLPGTVLEVFPPAGAAQRETPTSEWFFAELAFPESLPEGGVSPTRPVTLTAVLLQDREVSLTFGSETGVLYQVEYADALAPPRWAPLQTVEGTGRPVTLTDLPGAA